MDNYYRGSSRFDRINQDEVPKSKHTVFIRGLPGYIRTDEVKDFFEDHIGPCSFDFVKISPDQLKLFVAVRFETREAAKECMNKYRDSEVLGHPVELTWFKDIRRYVSYQQSQGSRTGSASRSRYASNRGQVTSNRSSYERSSRNEHRDEEEKDSSKKRVSSREKRSRSKSSSSPNSHSQRNSSRGRSSSAYSHHSRESIRRSHSNSLSVSPNHSNEVSVVKDQLRPNQNVEENDKGSLPLPASPYIDNVLSDSQKQNEETTVKGKPQSPASEKKSRKSKKDKKKKRKRSPSYSYSSSNDNRSSEEQTEVELRKKIMKKRQKALNGVIDVEEKSEEKSVLKSEETSIVGSSSGIPSVQNTTLKFGLESTDDLPKKIVKDNMVDPTIKPPKSAVDAGKYGSGSNGVSSSGTVDSTETKPRNPLSIVPPVSSSIGLESETRVGKSLSTNIPSTSRYLEDYGQNASIEQVREDSSLSKKRSILEELDDAAQFASKGLRLSTFTRQVTAESERDAKIARLPQELLTRFIAFKKTLDTALKSDCETFAFVVKMIVQKEPELEGRLRVALGEIIKDMEDKFYGKVDGYLDQLINLLELV